MEFFRIESVQQGGIGNGPSMRCPACGHRGTFEQLGGQTDVYATGLGLHFVQRKCPNRACQTHIFAVLSSSGDVVVSYPPDLIDFDPEGIPDALVDALGEAINCFAHKAYRAAAMMVRKTLEELCNAQGATGDNLKQRIEALGQKVILSPDLLGSLDALRLLGNDAAHIEVRTDNDVGPEEVAVAIDVTKEILKAVYQHKNLVARLDALTPAVYRVNSKRPCGERIRSWKLPVDVQTEYLVSA